MASPEGTDWDRFSRSLSENSHEQDFLLFPDPQNMPVVPSLASHEQYLNMESALTQANTSGYSLLSDDCMNASYSGSNHYSSSIPEIWPAASDFSDTMETSDISSAMESSPIIDDYLIPLPEYIEYTDLKSSIFTYENFNQGSSECNFLPTGIGDYITDINTFISNNYIDSLDSNHQDVQNTRQNLVNQSYELLTDTTTKPHKTPSIQTFNLYQSQLKPSVAQTIGPISTCTDSYYPSNCSLSSASQSYMKGTEESFDLRRCTYPNCGKVFKDLKAHMLTHQNERPEKCPIKKCEYHTKGFARKYDKNRHTLTHFKGKLVCGFCPKSGSSNEKSFNRADVFKKHLISVHSVEQIPQNMGNKTSKINAKKNSCISALDTTGQCSACSEVFANAQELYDHLDECVLQILRREQTLGLEVADQKENLQEIFPTKTIHSQSSFHRFDIWNSKGVDENKNKIHCPYSRPRRLSENKYPVNGVQKSRGISDSRGIKSHINEHKELLPKSNP